MEHGKAVQAWLLGEAKQTYDGPRGVFVNL